MGHRKILWALVVTMLFMIASELPGLAQTPKPRREFQLEAISPDFWKLIGRDAKLTTVGTGFGFTEGPMWDPAGFLYVSDETINKIYRLYPDGKKEEVLSLGDPDGNTFDRRHRLIDCASILRAVIELTPQGKYRILADHYQGKKLNTPNDVVVGPDGALYFTDPTLDFVADMKQELPFQGVYRLDEQGNLRLLIKDLSQPNGLAFSPDGRHFYVDDDEQKNIRVYDVAPDWSLANGRVFGEEKGGKGEGVPDGMKIDKQGNLFVVGPKGIWVWDAAGNHLGTIVTPEQPANLTWGDNDYRTLYITATTSVYRLQTTTAGFVPYIVDLNSVLDKMDRTAAGFRAVHADFNWTTVNGVVNDRIEQGGRIYFERHGGETRMFAEFDPPDAEQVLFSRGKIQIYKQKLGTVDVYDAGTHRDEAETFLRLGFGTSGREMRKSFDVKYAGEENIGSVLAAKLELTPKSESVRNHFPEILLWIDPENGISVQQKLIEKNESYRLTRYSNIRLPQKMNDKVFKLKTSGSITTTTH